MLNKKQIDDLAHFFLQELEAVLGFKVDFTIDDYLTFPPDEDISFGGIVPKIDVMMSIKTPSSTPKRLYPGFRLISDGETLNLISTVLNLDRRGETLVNAGYEKPNYEMDHLLGDETNEAYEIAGLISGIQLGITQFFSQVIDKVSKLGNKEVKKAIIEALIHHIEQRVVGIKNSLLTDLTHISVPFDISNDIILVIHCCEEKLNLDNVSSSISTRNAINVICLKHLLERLEALKTDLGLIYPKDIPTLSVSEDVTGNKYFNWLGWENYFLIQCYIEKYSDKTTAGIDFPDFVKLLAGRKYKEGKLEWYGSKSVLNAFFKDLHLLPQYLEKEKAHPIIDPIRKSLNIHEVFYLPNTDPKQQSKAFFLPINPKDISGRDVRNQQIFEPKKENVVVKTIDGTKHKSHQCLVLDLLGITLP